jgi:hypothetical protein
VVGIALARIDWRHLNTIEAGWFRFEPIRGSTFLSVKF